MALADEFIKKNGLEKDVVFVDSIKQEQLRYIYENTDVVLLPSKYEVFSMVMLESMYFGVPIITTNHGGSSTVIENGINSYILPLNKHEWTKTIGDLYEHQEEAKTMGEKAHATIKEKFCWSSIANMMIKTYEERKR